MTLEARHPLIAKAIRIVLVFSLVFWCSLGVEWAVAFGADDASQSNPAASTTLEQDDAAQRAAEEATQQQAADAAAAQEVIDAIAALPNPEDVTAADKSYVDQLTDRFYSLTNAQRDLVPSDMFIKLTRVQQAADAAAADAAAREEAQRQSPDGDAWGEERFTSGGHDQGTLVDIEAWSAKPDSIANSDGQRYADELIRSVGSTALEKEYKVPTLSSEDGSLQIVAVPKWMGDASLSDTWRPKVIESNFLKWIVQDNDGYADVTARGGVLDIQARKAGTFTVTCVVDNGRDDRGNQVGADYTGLIYSNFTNEYPDASFLVSLQVEVYTPAPYVTVELLQDDGTTCAGLSSLDLTDDELKSYAFQTNVVVHEHATGAVLDEIHLDSKIGLRDASHVKYGDTFSDLSWQVLDTQSNPVDASVATISDKGVLSVKKPIDEVGPLIVRAMSPDGLNGETGAQIQIGKGKPQPADEPDPQGESHPQNSLRITSNARVAAGEGAGAGAGEGTGEASDASGAAEGEGAADESSGIGTNAEGDAGSDGAADAAEGDGGAGNPAANTGEAAMAAIDKTYTLEDLAKLGLGTGTFAMSDASGAKRITGEGVNLAVLLADAGISDVSQITAIEFVNYREDRISIDWQTLSAGEKGVLLATRSRVLDADGSSAVKTQDDSEGSSSADAASASAPAASASAPAAPADAASSSASASDASSGAAAAEDTGDLLDNTRFRLLFDGAVSGSFDSLCWIKEINVSVGPGDGGNADESDLSVRVDYVPVALGKTAMLSAIPSQAVGNSRFGVTWQHATTNSPNEEDWVNVTENGSLQTLRVPTDTEHLGLWYRVLLTTDQIDPETGQARTALSKAVQIVEGKGFSVTLAYDPPIAGQTAIFQSNIEAIVDEKHITIDPSALEYIWEQSADGGQTWQTIPNASGPSLAVPTEPVKETPSTPAAENPDGGSDAQDGQNNSSQQEPVTLRYVRVRVITTDTRIPEDGRVAISNAQPLTVRVGGAGEDPDGGDDAGIKDDTSSQGTAPQLPSTDAVVTPINSITVDTTPRPAVDASTTGATGGQPQQQMPQAPQTPVTNTPQNTPIDELVINPEISAMIIDQQAEIDRATTSSKPGARWTKLSTVDPTNDDIRNILADNPFAPFVIPLGLAFAVAGGLEKYLGFRRQTR